MADIDRALVSPDTDGPMIRYFGSKWRIAPRIIANFPKHTTYIEPYAGSASIYFRKPRSPIEIIGDIDGDLVNLFRVVRDAEQSKALATRLDWTLYAREEYQAAFEPADADDPVERAARFFIRLNMSYKAASGNKTAPSAFLVIPAHHMQTRYRSLVSRIDLYRERLKFAVIENKPAEYLFDRYDTPGTLFYLDPPYHGQKERNQNQDYTHTFEQSDHEQLLDRLLSIENASVCLSHRPTELYDERLKDWKFIDLQERAHNQKETVERLYLNYEISEEQQELFI